MKIKNTIKSWLASGLIASLLFVMIRPQLVEAINEREIMGLYKMSKGVEIGTKVEEDGFRQINYEFENRETVITNDNYSHADPDADEEYIVWMAQTGSTWQIFRYNLITEETVQLTTTGNNVNPSVSGNKVAWEGQVDGVWQAFVFDGIKVEQVTRGSRAIQDIDLKDSWLVYREKTVDERSWIIKVKELVTGIVVDLGEGVEPKFVGDELVWWAQQGEGVVKRTYQFGVEKPEPTPSPEAVSEPSPEPSPEPSIETVTELDILEELEIATPSGQVEARKVEEATGSGELE